MDFWVLRFVEFIGICIVISNMKITNRKIVSALLAVLMGLLCVSCATYKVSLVDREYEGPLPDGAYTVIKYGGNHYDDFATFALLVPDNSVYKFEIYRPDFEYRTVKGVSANSARQIARDFVKGHPEFLRTASREIIAPDGSVAGYETRALYKGGLFGMADVFDVNYLLKADNVIEVRIKLDDAVLRYFMSGGSGSDSGK
jgi:hypothetical protein